MSPFSSKQLVIVGLVLLVGVGFFLRTYHFSDWLHFELDQARDARVIDTALHGSALDLPLLGPKAGGTFLRLAPGFYYLQYVSTLIFGGDPTGMAMFVLIFSTASIVIFYVFLRRYFGVRLALGLTALFAVSAYFVMYGRFAWNPNMLPFFVLFGFYALLRSVDANEIKKNVWLCASIFSITLATHSHFLAFLALPIIVSIFLLLRRSRFSWKVWLCVVGIVTILYTPMILNERATGFANTQEFFEAITKKSTKNQHLLVEKIIRNTSGHALYGMVIVTGFEGGMFPAITLSNGIQWVCASKCDAGKWYGVTAVLVLGAGILCLVWRFWQTTQQKPRDFLLLIGIWFVVTFGLFTPLAYDIAPRFFLLSGPIFFILVGLLLQKLRGIYVVGRFMVWGIILFFVLSNLYFLQSRFDELSRAGKDAIDSAPDRILKERIRVTLKQQNAIIDFLEKRYRETGYPVYMWSEPQHRRALKYLLEKRGIENAVLGFDGVYRQGVYYLVLRTQSNIENGLKKYREQYSVGTTTSFGTLIVLELIPKPEAMIGERQDFSQPKASDSQAPPRYTWREFLQQNASVSNAEEETPFDQLEDRAQDN